VQLSRRRQKTDNINKDRRQVIPKAPLADDHKRLTKFTYEMWAEVKYSFIIHELMIYKM
jgi:hypothetical protein